MPFKVKDFREKQNMTQKELCKKAGVSRTLLSDLENNKEVNVTVGILQKLAGALNCKFSDIFCLDCLLN